VVALAAWGWCSGLELSRSEAPSNFCRFPGFRPRAAQPHVSDNPYPVILIWYPYQPPFCYRVLTVNTTPTTPLGTANSSRFHSVLGPQQRTPDRRETQLELRLLPSRRTTLPAASSHADEADHSLDGAPAFRPAPPSANAAAPVSVHLTVASRDGGRGAFSIVTTDKRPTRVVGSYRTRLHTMIRFDIRVAGEGFRDLVTDRIGATVEALLPRLVREAPWELDANACQHAPSHA
jgi:hypothetical protein